MLVLNACGGSDDEAQSSSTPSSAAVTPTTAAAGPTSAPASANTVQFTVVEEITAEGSAGTVLSLRLQVTNNTQSSITAFFETFIGCAADGTYRRSYPDFDTLAQLDISDGSNGGQSLDPGLTDVIFAAPITVDSNMSTCSDGSASKLFLQLPGLTADQVSGTRTTYEDTLMLELPVDLTVYL